MTTKEITIDPGPLSKPADRGLFLSQGLKKRLFADRLAKYFVTLGGWTIIFCILAILFVIVAEFFPLFKNPSVVLETTIVTQEKSVPLATGLDEYREVAYVVNESGVHFYSLKTHKLFPVDSLAELADARVTAVSSSVDGFLVLGLSDGRVLPVNVEFKNIYSGDSRTVEPKLVPQNSLRVREDRQAIEKLVHAKSEDGTSIAAVTGPGKIAVAQVEERRTLMGTTKRETTLESLTFPVKGKISAMVFHSVEEALFVGTTSGQILRASLEEDAPGEIETMAATRGPGVAVTNMNFILGDYTLIVGDSEGGVSSFQWLKVKGEKPRLRKIYDFVSHSQPPTLFASSLRTKGFLTGAEKEIRVHYGSTGETQLTVPDPMGSRFKAVSLSRKADGILAVDSAGKIFHWTMNNPFPQITFKSVFGKVWYEGYEGPEYVWQSTGGTDAFESKFSLVPLIFGTLKGTLYAMLFAVPLAILGAFYTSQFMHHRLKGIVKPTIELMAALPSVVLGFFAALLIAPEVERLLPGVILMPVVIAGIVLAALLFYEVSDKLKNNIRVGREISLLVPLTFLGGMLSFYIGQIVEAQLLFGDHRTWLNELFNVTYDQRNALVVGLAMGFAVIPIIFTITEDSLSNVPEHLKASSLALGATPWQTALRVILPTASPGIFSAVMIGFGRAVGETMIVLMATGNTPVMEWSIFNGFRALSANIAVELPEAPEGGTLFRLLFLAAFLLFVMTFVINTAAELVRLRLRKRYRVL
ncbi:MAG: phosphate ABC transporter permease [Nitrospinaceae bacterium]|nr:MAG: phosphate ABC transporter permease [Nitrospinaceae bacterium]